MTVELWYGEKPKHPSEQNVLIELFQFLEPREEHFVLLTNFHAGASKEIDLVVLKENAVFLAELKHYWDKLVGGKEGKWKFIRPNGTARDIPRNPYKQVRDNSFSWQKWCERRRDELSAGIARSCPVDYSRMFCYIVIYPDLHPDSQLDIGDHPVQAVGLQKFLIALPIMSSQEVGLSRQEMQRIATLLQLTRWHILPPKKEDITVELVDDWQPPPVRMLVARGHDFSESVLYLEKELIRVGRDEDSDLVINDQSVSRHHAEIRYRDNRYIVRDLESLNGTFVSYSGDPHLERRVETDNALKNGSIVRFGQASYTLLINE